MSYIVSRDIFGMEFEDDLLTKIDRLDDEIIRRYQEGWVRDEYGPNWTMEMAIEDYKKRGYIGEPFPSGPGSFDTLLILHKMIESGEVKFDGTF